MASKRISEKPRRIAREHVLRDPAQVVEAQRHVLSSYVRPHDHDFVELVLITAGNAQHVAPTGEHTLRRGSCMLLRPGSWHAYENCKQLKLYNCYFGPELLDRELHWLAEDAAMASLIWTGPGSLNVARCCLLTLDQRRTSQCEKLLRQIADDESSRAIGRIARIGILLCVFELIAESVSSNRNRLLPAKVHPLVRRGQRMLEADMSDEWTLGLLADQLHTGRHHLSRLFREHTELPPMAYLAHLRALHAGTLLLASDDPIGEIARQVGWPDANYFARRFKQHFKCSASEYRSRYSTQQIVSATTTFEKKLP